MSANFATTWYSRPVLSRVSIRSESRYLSSTSAASEENPATYERRFLPTFGGSLSRSVNVNGEVL